MAAKLSAGATRAHMLGLLLSGSTSDSAAAAELEYQVSDDWGDGSMRRWRDGKPMNGGKLIPTGQGMVHSLIQLKNGELISGGDDVSLRRWRDGKPVGDGRPILTGMGNVGGWGMIELKNDELIIRSIGGELRIVSP